MGDKKGKKTAKRVDPEVELTVEEQLRRNAAKEELDFARSLYETEAVKRESKRSNQPRSNASYRYC